MYHFHNECVTLDMRVIYFVFLFLAIQQAKVRFETEELNAVIKCETNVQRYKCAVTIPNETTHENQSKSFLAILVDNKRNSKSFNNICGQRMTTAKTHIEINNFGKSNWFLCTVLLQIDFIVKRSRWRFVICFDLVMLSWRCHHYKSNEQTKTAFNMRRVFHLCRTSFTPEMNFFSVDTPLLFLSLPPSNAYDSLFE